VGEALLLFALFATQLLIPDPQFRYYYALGYVLLAVGWITLKPGYREAVVALLARDASPAPANDK
jgi:hypothetical protein